MVYSPFPFFDQFLSLAWHTHRHVYLKAPLRQLSWTPKLLPVPLYLITFLFCQWFLCFYENYSNCHSLLRLKWCKIDLIHGTKFTSCCRKEVIIGFIKHKILWTVISTSLKNKISSLKYCFPSCHGEENENSNIVLQSSASQIYIFKSLEIFGTADSAAA